MIFRPFSLSILELCGRLDYNKINYIGYFVLLRLKKLSVFIVKRGNEKMLGCLIGFFIIVGIVGFVWDAMTSVLEIVATIIAVALGLSFLKK